MVCSFEAPPRRRASIARRVSVLKSPQPGIDSSDTQEGEASAAADVQAGMAYACDGADLTSGMKSRTLVAALVAAMGNQRERRGPASQQDQQLVDHASEYLLIPPYVGSNPATPANSAEVDFSRSNKRLAV
jgi:hypothetical protein